MLNKYGTSKDYDYSGFINSDGNFILCPSGVEHWIVCKQARTTLEKYLNSGGIRTMAARDRLAIENGNKPITDEQMYVISAIIRLNGPQEIVGFIDGNEFYINNVNGVKFHQFKKELENKSCTKC